MPGRRGDPTRAICNSFTPTGTHDLVVAPRDDGCSQSVAAVATTRICKMASGETSGRCSLAHLLHRLPRESGFTTPRPPPTGHPIADPGPSGAVRASAQPHRRRHLQSALTELLGERVLHHPGEQADGVGRPMMASDCSAPITSAEAWPTQADEMFGITNNRRERPGQYFIHNDLDQPSGVGRWHVAHLTRCNGLEFANAGMADVPARYREWSFRFNLERPVSRGPPRSRAGWSRITKPFSPGRQRGARCRPSGLTGRNQFRVNWLK